MEVKRYIIVEAILTDDKELIPIWDESLLYENHSVFGKHIKYKNKRYYGTVECVYDLKSKKLSVGLELDIYPNEYDMSYKKGETVYYEKDHRKLIETKIVDIVFEDYNMSIKKGSKIDAYVKSRLGKDVVIEKDVIYAIKQHIPFYVLEGGEKIKYEHQLYHKKF